tara:strand:- start:22 stop:156 length:135 start_codon:yes stop_codon:yes gene_type:complete
MVVDIRIKITKLEIKKPYNLFEVLDILIKKLSPCVLKIEYKDPP